MAKKAYEETKIAAIAEKIREKTGGEETYTTAEMPSGVDAAYEAGKKAEYDAFWDGFQQNGARANYDHAFYNKYWTDEIFKPKYDIIVTDSLSQAFRSCAVTDLAKRLSDLGIILDTSKAVDFSYTFCDSKMTVLPTISTVSVAKLNYTFHGADNLHTIEKLILKSDGSQSFLSTFGKCNALENIVIEGCIGNNIDFSYSHSLSKASITSIINALSTTTSGLSIMLSTEAVKNAFATSDQPYGQLTAEWKALEASRSNWTIGLV